MKVLAKKQRITDARRRLVIMNVSTLEPNWQAQLRCFGFRWWISVGDEIKSWDVLQTLEFLLKNVPKDKAILDIGAYASEVIVALRKLGYSSLTAVDLNPELKKMPYSESIRYEISDFLHTPFGDSSFRAITSISVIEHGYNGPPLLQEVSRLLALDGFFIASFDYWPQKIDTSGIKLFGMDWLIFSKSDVEHLINLASDYGLQPVGGIEYEADEKPIRFAGMDYTFGWIVFKKSR